MDIAAAIDEIVTQLDTITGLHPYGYDIRSVRPPFAIVQPSEVDYDQTYRRGMDKATLEVLLGVSSVSSRAERDELLAYVAGSGTKSVKAVIEAGTYAHMHTTVVTRAELSPITVASTTYVGVIFQVDITGQGS